MKRTLIIFFLTTFSLFAKANYIFITMGEDQKNHLKAYGIAYYALQKDIEISWLLNYEGGSFMMPYSEVIEKESIIRGITYEIIANTQASAILAEIADAEVNMDEVKLQKAPKIAVYSPKNKQPWDDAVTLALTYAEIPYTVVFDKEVMDGELPLYDWLHLHHEDFTGQYGKFWSAYQNAAWYKEDVKYNEDIAASLGYKKVSELKLAVAKKIRDFVAGGGYLFAMCSAPDSYDVSMAADGVDICESMFDGDGMDANAQKKLNYDNCFAFTDFIISTNPYEYEISSIDVTQGRKVLQKDDYFSLFEFSAKWDQVPTMLCQDHTMIIKGFMGQTTAFRSDEIKSNVLIMGENKAAGEAKYIHGEYGKGTFTFLGGHDPEDYNHMVGDPATDLSLYPNSPGYRLILNNVLFPAAKKKKQKT
ncbi:MAG TPA: asparagine synthetase B [Bacteroidales bacterium]|nr:asparagine synthetase B [Bacteroidales bacterium]HPS18012.1 asparagine synthetase B [Bacteroidales bacterium]